VLIFAVVALGVVPVVAVVVVQGKLNNALNCAAHLKQQQQQQQE